MNPTNNNTIQDSNPSGSLTVGQLKALVREEILMSINGGANLEPLLDAEDVAKILGVDTAYVYSLARDRKIPSVKLGKYRKFSSSQVKKWLDRKNTS